MDARELLRLAFTDGLDLPPQKLHVVFNLPELALEILADELRGLTSTRRFSIHCYTFQTSLKRLEDLSFIEITHVRCVRFVSPSKAMFCVHIEAQSAMRLWRSCRICELTPWLVTSDSNRLPLDTQELPLNVEEIPVEDLLQWCASCQGYKPPGPWKHSTEFTSLV